MAFIFVLTVVTIIIWPNSEMLTFLNTYDYSSMEKCVAAKTYVEKDRGQPPDKAFTVKHIGKCITMEVE